MKAPRSRRAKGVSWEAKLVAWIERQGVDADEEGQARWEHQNEQAKVGTGGCVDMWACGVADDERAMTDWSRVRYFPPDGPRLGTAAERGVKNSVAGRGRAVDG